MIDYELQRNLCFVLGTRPCHDVSKVCCAVSDQTKTRGILTTIDSELPTEAKGTNVTTEDSARDTASRPVSERKTVLIFTLMLNRLATANHNSF